MIYEGLLLPVLLYASEAMIWREKERSGIRAVEMDNLRCLLGIRRKDRVPKTQIIELCKLRKGLIKDFSIGLAILKESRMIGLLKVCM